ncbi:phage major capsid protein [Methylocystis sp. WRRC1]|uniref:phage major capsid protein n=1 Tax=Methylocystis sp. WRRC1 TaxID=1732014 RepID=UPI001D13D72D|nr:phage major capsid protein [Methylocystis sp. WRRC1]MCC3247435.1 phage major capsid protein [Methylocystis sp. WRRC1]
MRHVIPELRKPAADRAKPVFNAAWAATIRAAGKRQEAEAIERSDDVARRLLQPLTMRAPIAPGTTTGSGWADDVVTGATGAFVSSIAPLSAGARLIEAGERVDLGATSTISYPTADTSPGAAPWVAEAEPIGVRNFSFDSATLGPAKKVATILPVSRENVKRSAGRAVFDRMLREVAAHSLDLAIFGDQAASAAACAGLRNGVTPIASTGDVGSDVAALLAEVANLGGSGAAAIIMNPREAAVAAVALPQLAIPTWASRAVPAGTVLALDPSDFASAISDIEIYASEESVIHMEDSAPAEIVSATGPATADPVRSAFQTGVIALRMILELSFIARAGRVATMTGVSWS